MEGREGSSWKANCGSKASPEVYTSQPTEWTETDEGDDAGVACGVLHFSLPSKTLPCHCSFLNTDPIHRPGRNHKPRERLLLLSERAHLKNNPISVQPHAAWKGVSGQEMKNHGEMPATLGPEGAAVRGAASPSPCWAGGIIADALLPAQGCLLVDGRRQTAQTGRHDPS